jgi:hypothetical protein
LTGRCRGRLSIDFSRQNLMHLASNMKKIGEAVFRRAQLGGVAVNNLTAS